MTRKGRMEETAAEQLYKESLVVKKTKMKIADICHQIMENPEGNIDRIAELLRLLEHQETGGISEVRRLTCLSLCEVFCDVLPSYRIRPLTDKEKSQKTKKETKKLQAYEEKLLMHYKKFTTVLAKMIRGQPLNAGKAGPGIAVQHSDEKVGVKCAGALLNAHPLFNHAEDLMKMLIPVLNYDEQALKSKPRRAAHLLTAASLGRLLREDRAGHASLAFVRGLVQFARSRAFRVEVSVVASLLHLNVRETAAGAGQEWTRPDRQQRHGRWSRRQRKDEKKGAKFQQEMRQLQASQSRASRLRLNSKIVAQLFLLYFKLLQTAGGVEAKLLSAVLVGLSKHAHLISVDFFDDLFRSFNDLLDRQGLSPADSVACVHTAMTVLTGQGEALQVDPRRFYSHLYARLLPAVLHADHACLRRVLDTLELMLVKRRRQVSLERSTAFIKRLATCALVSPSAAVSCRLLAFVHRLLRQEPRAAALLLDADPDKGQGRYDPDAAEPEFANASAATLWELAGLQSRHADVEVRRNAGLALGALAQPAGVPACPPAEEEGALACVASAERCLQELQRLVEKRPSGKRKRRLEGCAEPGWVAEKLRKV